MAYEIHIDRIAEDGSRVDPRISLDEWKSIIKETDDVRLDSSVKSITNPTTGDVITIGGTDGDAEMLIDGQWRPVFRWSAGHVSITAHLSFHAPNDPVRRMTTELAARLKASVVGDGGEIYD